MCTSCDECDVLIEEAKRRKAAGTFSGEDDFYQKVIEKLESIKDANAEASGEGW